MSRRPGQSRVAVITGGSSGIGAALARKLATGGIHCILVARGRERLERLAEEVGAEAEVCDVGDGAAVDGLAARVGERHGAIHLLVNNAGIPGRGGFLELDAEQIDRVTRTNYLGSVWCVRAFLSLLEAGAPSHVVNIVSVAGTVSGGATGPYAAAKHAQLVLSRSVAPELESRGIRVLSVNPGPVRTDGFPQRELLEQRAYRRLVIEPEAVADAVVRALVQGRREVFVPGYLRLAALLAGVAPVTVGRLATRRRPRPGRR